MTNVTFEQATLLDAEQILALQKLAYRSEAALYEDDALPPLLQTLEELREEFEAQVFLKASAEERIVGSVRAFVQDSTCFIGRLIVHPQFQGQGIGSALMTEIERRFEAERLELFTGHKSEGNIRLYEKLGYASFKTQKLTDTLSLVFMEKRA